MKFEKVLKDTSVLTVERETFVVIVLKVAVIISLLLCPILGWSILGFWLHSEKKKAVKLPPGEYVITWREKS